MIGVKISTELSAFAAEVGDVGSVAVEGARTRWLIGGQVADGTRIIRAPVGVIAHRPEEMTVAVLAGTSVADLHRVLAEAGQRTALPERGGTVGGALAVGENDLRVLGRGRVASSLLQVRYVSADGRVITGGGPTVKNVSGFDLPRLIVGSLGTVGLIGEALLRTNPIPAASLWLRSEDTDPFAVREVVLRPSAILWDGASTWIQLEGHTPDVLSEAAVLGRLGRFEVVSGPPKLPPFRWSFRPKDLRTVDAARLGTFIASIGVGTVFASRIPPVPRYDRDAGVVARRIKAEFDPTGRLNPGRIPGGPLLEIEEV